MKRYHIRWNPYPEPLITRMVRARTYEQLKLFYRANRQILGWPVWE